MSTTMTHAPFTSSASRGIAAAIKPNFFIVGAAKCGTTSLHDYLSQHPQVFMSDPKEPYYFGRDLRCAAHCSVLDEGEYLKLFANAGRADVIGEASVWYLPSKQAAKEIKAYTTEPKIVISLRNPVDMMYSLHYEFLTTGDEDILDFKAAVEAGEDRRQGKRIPANARFPDCMVYLDMASYAAQVERYFSTFGRDRVRVVIFDDFAADAMGVYRSLLEFLEINPDFTPQMEQHRKSKPMTGVDLSIKRLAMRHHGLRSLLKKTPQSWRDAYYNLAPKLFRKVRPQKIDPILRHEYQLYFREDIERLGEMLGRDLSHWLQP